jgi:hypothetical protein
MRAVVDPAAGQVEAKCRSGQSAQAIGRLPVWTVKHVHSEVEHEERVRSRDPV